MGNCQKKKSTAEWGGGGEILSPKPTKSAPSETEPRRRRGQNNKCKKVHFDPHVEVLGGEYEQLKAGMEQVRIRITKKRLEELLGKLELENLSVHEMMSCLINGGEQSFGELQKDDGQNPP